MIIKDTSISLTFNRIEDLKKTYYNNEYILKDQFNEANVLPVPDDAPDEMPRIVIKSLNEHSELRITPVNATLQIFYDTGYEQNWNLCSSYILEKMRTVFKFLNLLTGNKYNYLGIVTEILMDEIKCNGATTLAKNLLATDDVSKIYDLNVRYTFVEKDNMFVNIMLQNARLYKDGTNGNIPGSFSEKNQVAESIGAVIDINDRYAFNSSPNYQTDSKKLEQLINEMTYVLTDKLRILIEQGVY